MTPFELPHPLEAYFAFSELPATERGRHFTITFTYKQNERLDRLQWWWQVNRAQERTDAGQLAAARLEAIQRFRQHIERWLINSGRCLRGGAPFPLLEFAAMNQPAKEVGELQAQTAPEAAFVEQVRAHARLAVGS
jgi:hypothetical protein